MQDLEDDFRLSYRKFEEVVPFIAEGVLQIVNLSMKTSSCNTS